MTIVRNAIAALTAELGSDYAVTWENTGGGCFAIAVRRAGVVESEAPQILITDGEDVYAASDYDRDSGVCGFWANLYTSYDDDNPAQVYAEQYLYIGDEHDDDEHREEFTGASETWAHTVEGRRAALAGIIPAMVSAVAEAARRAL